jgi:hypothetical protein
VKIDNTSNFKKNFKRLFKKNKHLLFEYEQLINNLQINPTLGTHIGNGVYKIRLVNQSNNKGKSGGYRVITYTKIEDMVLLVDIYSKSDTSNLKESIIDTIIEEFLNTYKV